ncbi:MAG: amidase [Granulosicoccus sp.]|nr:amidase [Granulosicoccus sp.]
MAEGPIATPLTEMPLRELSNQFARREISCLSVAEHCLAQRKLLDPGLHAYHQYYDDRLLDAARHADRLWEDGVAQGLCGIPFSIKNIMAADGYTCYPGTRSAAPAAWETSGSIVALLQQQYSLLTGTTHASELAVGGLGVNEHWGMPRNPWDKTTARVPGGSSAGAAISVLQGACSFALGTDTGGSVRVPASAAGMVGLKTTSGRWPVDGVVPLASRFDSVGVIARTVDDVRCVFDQIDTLAATADAQPGFTGTSLSDFRFTRASELCWQGLDPGIGQALELALDDLHSAGAVIHDDDTLFAKAAELRDQGPNTAAYECNILLQTLFPSSPSVLSRHVAQFLEGAKLVDETAYRKRLAMLIEWRAEVDAGLTARDIILSPTLRETPPTRAATENPEVYAHYSDSLLHNTVLGSMNGLCAITLPVGLDAEGIPVGLQLAAKANCEATLLHVAALVEQAIGDSLQRCGYPPLIESLYNSRDTLNGAR